ncbi:MAG TPA: pyridoxamine 5'-phosphate oxidase family protein [Bacillota bacterium]|nr:pyridoxamine 5'-phosphate oxidase family protein [Bacillota bacterium]
MDQELAFTKGLELIQKSKIALLGSVDMDGYPNMKAMLNLKNNGLKEIWFSTNTSSKRVAQFSRDQKASVYYVDENNFEGLMLIGKIQLLQDDESRKMLWFDGCEKYYPQGVNDPDYTVLKFTAHRGNYYHGLANIDFSL